MTNTELINAYLDNELSDADRMNFEQRLEGDAVLQQELALQKDVIEGIRLARKAQLKQMLNNVPVAQTTVWSAGKIASVATIIAATIAGIFYFMPDNESEVPSTATTELTEPQPETTQEVIAEAESNETQNDLPEESETVENEPVADTTEETIEEKVETQPENKRPVVAPNFEREDTERSDVTAPDGSILGEIVSTPSDTEVEIEAENGNYNFHYAFEPGMLKLYGDFEKELYEILEFNSAEGSVWFLEYQEKFYFLDNSSSDIRPLSEVTDAKLLEVLTNIE